MTYALRSADGTVTEAARVTEVIRDVLAPSDDLDRWRLRRVVTLSAAHRISADAAIRLMQSDRTSAARGLHVHAWIAATLRTQRAPSLTPSEEPFTRQWSRWRDAHPWPVHCIEQTVTTRDSPVVAGTFDAQLIDETGRRWLYDWKTVTTIPPTAHVDHVAQLGAYATLRDAVESDGTVTVRLNPCDRAAVVYLSVGALMTAEVNLVIARRIWRSVLSLWHDKQAVSSPRAAVPDCGSSSDQGRPLGATRP